MRKRHSLLFPSRRFWLSGIPALGLLSASADTVTWTGNGADSAWSTAGNWNPGVPADGDEIVFPASAAYHDVALDAVVHPSKLHFTSTGFNDYFVEGTGGIAGENIVIQKDGDAWLTLGGGNSFTGEILLNAGKLLLAPEPSGIASVSYAFGASGNTIRIAPGATLDLNGLGAAAHASAQAADRRFFTVEIAGNGIEEYGIFRGAITSGGSLSFGGYGKTGLQHVILTADASIDAPEGIVYDLGLGPAGATAGTSGSITSAGGVVRTLTKTGPGAVQLGGTNLSSDEAAGVIVHVAEGVLYGNGPTSFGDKLIIGQGAEARTWVNSPDPITVPVEIQDGGKLSNYYTAITFSGPFTLGGTATFSASNVQNLIIDSVLDGPADVVVQRDAASGNLVFTQDNTIDGELILSGSITAQLGTGAASGSFKDRQGNHSPVNLGTAGTVALNRSDDFLYNAPVSGTGTLSKQGAGTVRRSIPAEFSRPGGTVATVGAGTLLVNNTEGYGLGEGTVTVSASATLGGTGSVAGTVSLGTANLTSGQAFLAPGDGPGAIGTFTIGALTLASNGSGTLRLEIDGAAADKLEIGGNALLSLAKTAEIELIEIGAGATEASYTLLEYTGEFYGTFSAVAGLPEGYRLRHDTDAKRIVLEQSSEPVVLPLQLYFDGGDTDIAEDGDGAAATAGGLWNNTLKNWDQGPAAHAAWANDGSAVAVFATSDASVEVDDPAPLVVAGIKRLGTTTSTTVISGGTLALQPGAALHNARFGSSDQGLRIASQLTGAGGFTVTGGVSSGTSHSRVTLVNPLPGDNTITGPVSILGGHLRLQASHQLGDDAVVTANTVIAGAVATLETGSNVNETIAGLHFGPNGGELKLGGSGVSELTLDGGGLSIANAATFTYGNSASGIRFANGGELSKAGGDNVDLVRTNPANFIDLGGPDRTLRVEGPGSLTIGVNLLNGGIVKQGAGALALTSDANAYEGDTTVAEGILRLTYPLLHDASSLEIAAGASLELAFATAETADVVKSLIVAGTPLPAGTYGPAGSTLPGVTPMDAISGAGLIVVEPGGTPSNPYGDWASSFGLDPETEAGGPAGDFDRDGLANMVEYVLGSDPAAGVSGNLPTAERQGDTLVFVFTRTKAAAEAGFVAGVEYSSTLTSWTAAEAAWISVADGGDTETVTVAIPVPEGTATLFARLTVTAP